MPRTQARAIVLTVLMITSVVAVAGVGFAGAATGASDSPTTITGELTYSDGSNVSQAKVLAAADDSVPYDFTDPGGRFGVNVSQNSSYNVWFQQYRPSSSSLQNFPRDGKVDIWPLGTVDTANGEDIGAETIPNGSVLEVQVLDTNGEPVPDAEIGLSVRANGATAYAGGQTNADGDLVLDNAAQSGVEITGQVEISVDGPSGYGDNVSTVSVSSNRSVTIRVDRSATISGQVVDASGTGVEGDRIELDPVTDTGRSYRAVTGPNGSFSREVDTNTTFEARFSQRSSDGSGPDYPKDGIPDVHPLGTVETGTSNVSLGQQQLPAGHLLNVTVVDENGDPVEDVRFNIEIHGTETRAYVFGTSNVNGELVLDGAATPGLEASGEVEVNVDPSSSQYASTEVTTTLTSDESIEVTLEPTINVTTTVEEPDGTAAAGERISAYGVDGSDGGDTVWTNQSGGAQLQVAESGEYEVGFVQVASEGSFDSTFPADGVPDIYALGIANASAPDLGTVTLPSAHNLTVEVVDSQGNPVDAQVVFTHRNDGARFTRPQQTDTNGVASAELVGDVQVYVDPTAETYRTNFTEITLTADRELSITVTEGAPVSGQLTYPDGTSANGVEVSAIGEGGSGDVTDSNGEFSFQVDPNGSYDFAYRQTDFDGQNNFPKDGIADLYAFGEITPGSDGVDLGTKQIPEGHLLDVRVVNESGAALDGLDVGVEPVFGNASGYQSATTTADGRVILDGAATPGIEANGTVRIEVDGGDQYETVEEEVTVDAERNLTISLAGQTTISGRFVDSGGGAPSGSVAAIYRGLNGMIRYADENGRFSATVSDSGEYNIVFGQYQSNFTRDNVTDIYYTGPVSVNDSDVDVGNITIPDSEGILTIRAVSENGSPVEGVNASIIAFNGSDPGKENGYAVGYFNTTNEDGYLAPYGQRGIEANGSYVVGVSVPENSTRFVSETYRRNVTVTNDTSVTFTLQPKADTGPQLSGQVELPDGTPVEEGSYVLINGSGAQKTVRTGANGSWTADLPANGTYEVAVFQNGTDSITPRDGVVDFYDAGDYEVDGPTNASTITLPEGYVLDTRVVDQDGQPIRNASVVYSLENFTSEAGWGLVTNEDGLATDSRYGTVTGGEVLGNVTVEITPPEGSQYVGETVTRNVSVTENRTIEATFEERRSNVSVNYSVEATEVTEGEPINVTATVENTGELSGTKNVTLVVENATATAVRTTKEVTVDPGETRAVEFSTTVSGGTWDVTVDDLDETKVNVRPPVSVNVVAPKQMGVGQNETAYVVVNNVDAGVGTFDVNLSVANGSVVEITEATAVINGSDRSSVRSARSARLRGVFGDTNDTGTVRLAEVVINASSVGETTLRVDSVSVGSEDGYGYAVEATQADTVEVVAVPAVGDFSAAPTDPDDDGTFEDVNGDGTFDLNDVQALFDNSDGEIVTEYGSAFDFNGNGEFDLVDVQALYDELNGGDN